MTRIRRRLVLEEKEKNEKNARKKHQIEFKK